MSAQSDWVVLRSEADSTPDFKHPTGWIDNIKGFEVKPEIGEFGGILINDEAIQKYMADHAWRPSKANPAISSADPAITEADYVKKPPPTKEGLAHYLAAQRVNGWFAMPLQGIAGPAAAPAAAPVAEPAPVDPAPAVRAPISPAAQAAARSLEDTLDARIEAIKAAGGPAMAPGRPTIAKKEAYIRANEQIT